MRASESSVDLRPGIVDGRLGQRVLGREVMQLRTLRHARGARHGGGAEIHIAAVADDFIGGLGETPLHARRAFGLGYSRQGGAALGHRLKCHGQYLRDKQCNR